MVLTVQLEVTSDPRTANLVMGDLVTNAGGPEIDSVAKAVEYRWFGRARLLRRSEVTQLGRMHEGNRLGSAQMKMQNMTGLNNLRIEHGIREA